MTPRADTPLDGETEVFRRPRSESAASSVQGQPQRPRVVLNLYARLMIRVVVIVIAGLLLSLVVGRDVLAELAVFAAVFLPIVVLMGVLAVRRVSAPIRQLIDASQRLLEGDYEAPVEISRWDEIGFLASVLQNMQVYLRRNRAVMNAVLDTATGGEGDAGKNASIVELAAKTAKEYLPIASLEIVATSATNDPDGYWQRAAAEPIAASEEPVRRHVERALGKKLGEEEAARTYALVVPDAAGDVHDVAIAVVTSGRKLAGENLRYLRAIVGVVAFHRERKRLRDRSAAQDVATYDARAVGHVLGRGLEASRVEGLDVAWVRRARSAEPRDWVASADLRPRGGALVVACGDVLASGAAAAIARAAIAGAMDTFAHVASAGDASPAGVAGVLGGALRAAGGDSPAASAFVVALRDGAATIDYASAGHLPPIHIADDARELPAEGSLLGAGASRVTPRQVELARGDVVLVPSDGLVDGVSTDGAPFGRERIIAAALAAKVAKKSAQEIADAVLAAFDAFAASGGEADRDADDASLLVVMRPR